MRHNFYLIKQIKENLLYLTILIAIILYFVYLVFYTTGQYDSIQNKIGDNTTQIADLTTKRDFILYKNRIGATGIDPDSLNSILSMLVPDKEDFFTIIQALETLSSKSQFVITGYTLNLGDSKAQTIPLSVTGTGNRDAFLNFLENYNFGGNRLITIDNIAYNGQGFSQITLNLYFYSGQSVKNPNSYVIRLTDQDKKLIETIKNKVNFELTASASSSLSQPYATKNNPF